MILAVRVVRGITEHFALRYHEWVCSLMIFVLSLQLLRPGNTFASPAYAVMAHIASEETWGFVLLALSGLRLVALTLNGTFTKMRRFSPPIRSAGSLVSSTIWIFLSVTFFTANPYGFGVVICLGLAFTEVFVGIKTAREVGVAERDHARERAGAA